MTLTEIAGRRIQAHFDKKNNALNIWVPATTEESARVLLKSKEVGAPLLDAFGGEKVDLSKMKPGGNHAHDGGWIFYYDL